MIDPIARLLGTWSANITVYSVILRFVLSLLLGALIGSERATKMHEAGLKTFIIVSLTCTIATLIDVMISISSSIGCIPIVTAASIIGTAILGSNTILFSSKNRIKGLTTSGALCACGLLGASFGAGFYTIGLIGFIVVICCLSFSRSFETFIKDRSNHFEAHLELKDRGSLKEFVSTIRKLGLKIDDIEYNPAYANSGLSVYSMAFKIESPELKKYKTHKEIIEAIRTLDYVYYIEEMN
ncbi:MAG: MgtC/SapB family protein [Clostridia bacterium]|nr:MgtC/SapB family protein [Clostridia bacterium]